MSSDTAPHRYPTRWKLSRLPSKVPRASGSRTEVLVPRKKDERHILSFPREIIINILVLIPAKLLHEVVRYVCKQWYDIVCDPLFVTAHYRHMPIPDFLVQDFGDWQEIFQVYDILPDNAELNFTKIHIPFRAKLIGSCNGLICLRDYTNPELFHLMNPVTKVTISLPPVVGLKYGVESSGFGIDSSGHYKVVHVYVEFPFGVKAQMRVFTLGVDKAWRFIDLQGIPINQCMIHALSCDPLYIAGVLYWCSRSLSFLALDVDKETLYQFFTPKDFGADRSSVKFLDIGTSLALMKGHVILWRVWKLTLSTDVKLGEWNAMAGFDMRSMIDRVDKMLYPSKSVVIMPVRLIDGVLWFFRIDDDQHYVGVRYILGTGNFGVFRLNKCVSGANLYPYVPTLLPPK